MISGHYLGEIFRQVLVEMVEEGVLFLGQVSYLLMRRETQFRSELLEHLQNGKD